MRKSNLAAATLLTFGVVSLNVLFRDVSEAGKKQKPQCLVARTDPKAELPPRNAGIPQGVSVNSPVTFKGFQCIPRDGGSANCAFFYNSYGELKCKPITGGEL